MGPPPRNWRPTRWDTLSTYSTHARRTPLQPQEGKTAKQQVAHATVQPTAAAPRARVHVNPIADATDPRLASSSRQAAASPGLGVDFDALLGATSSSAGITHPLPSGPSSPLRVSLPSGPSPCPPARCVQQPLSPHTAAADRSAHRIPRRPAGRCCVHPIPSRCGAACRRGFSRAAEEDSGHDGRAVQVT